jgi:hypothetical protein
MFRAFDVEYEPKCSATSATPALQIVVMRLMRLLSPRPIRSIIAVVCVLRYYVKNCIYALFHDAHPSSWRVATSSYTQHLAQSAPESWWRGGIGIRRLDQSIWQVPVIA